MSAHTVVAIKGIMKLPGAMKMAVVTFTGSASYDSGGSVINLGTGGVLGVDGFTTVHALVSVGSSSVTGSTYGLEFLPAASDAAATPLVVVNLLIQATPAQTSGDLSAITFRALVIGT